MRLGFAMKLIAVMIFASTLFRCVSAANHTVGGLSGWDAKSDLQTWSNSITFKLGDNLVFKYGPLRVPIQKLAQQSNAPSPSTSSSSDDSSSSPPSSRNNGGGKPLSRPPPPGSSGDSPPLAPPITVQAQAPAPSSSPGNDGAGWFTLLQIVLIAAMLLLSLATLCR